MKQYQDLVRELIQKYDETLTISSDRTGVGTVKVVGRHLRFNLADGFPQLTLKKTVWKSMVAELLWFLSGSTDNDVLEAMGCKFWRPWAVTEKDIVQYYLKRDGRDSQKHIEDYLVQQGMLKISAPDKPLQGLEGWISCRDKVTNNHIYQHPDYWKAYLELMITEGRIPVTAANWVGQLGPIYSESWVQWDDIRIVDGDSSIPAGFSDMGFLDEQSPDSGARVIGRSINQIQNAVDLLKNNPNSRRIIVNAWDPRHIPEDFWPDGSKKTPQENVIEGRASLAFCHAFFQFVTEEISVCERARHYILTTEVIDEQINEGFLDRKGVPKHRLNCLVTIRSSDTALGLPVNIASYALLTHMFAQVTNMTPGEVIINTGDSHLYSNQIEPMRAILDREPLPLPTLRLNPDVKNIFQFREEDIELVGYTYHPEIKMGVAV